MGNDAWRTNLMAVARAGIERFSSEGYVRWSRENTEKLFLPASLDDPRVAVDQLEIRDRRLREQHPSMPVVVVTGFDPRAPEADLRGLGGPIVRLGKPFDCDELLARLADLLGGGPAAGVAAERRRRASDARVPAGR